MGRQGGLADPGPLLPGQPGEQGPEPQSGRLGILLHPPSRATAPWQGQAASGAAAEVVGPKADVQDEGAGLGRPRAANHSGPVVSQPRASTLTKFPLFPSPQCLRAALRPSLIFPECPQRESPMPTQLLKQKVPNRHSQTPNTYRQTQRRPTGGDR